MTDEVNRSSNPIILIIALTVFLAAGWFASRYFSQPEPTVATPLSSPAGCDISQQSCSVSQGDMTITVDITPRTIRSMVPLEYRVRVSGVEVESAMLEMQGVDMFMGLNQTPLQASTSEPGLFTGTGELGVCTTGEMTWRATVTVNTASGPVQTWFDFRAK